jgi:predicted heme/steroid binding protein
MKLSKTLDDSPLFRDLATGNSSARIQGSNLAVYTAEYLASKESGQVGRTVYFNDLGNKQLSADFVPGLSLDGTHDVSYYIDENRPSADLPVATSTAAIARAMVTWESVACSELGLHQIPYNASISTGYIAALLGLGGSFEYTADVVHSGWLPAAFFDAIAEDGSTFILGVTFTIIFTDDEGNPVDTDNNGKLDVAWREIYYNDTFTWQDGAHYDVETIALHEAGHGLSQAHFGKAFASGGNGTLHFAPRAVMNAAYSGIQTEIRATDNGGHCSNWASWPMN